MNVSNTKCNAWGIPAKVPHTVSTPNRIHQSHLPSHHTSKRAQSKWQWQLPNWESHWDTAVYTHPGCHCVMFHRRVSLNYPGSVLGSSFSRQCIQETAESLLGWADGSLGGWDPAISWMFSRWNLNLKMILNVETNFLTFVNYPWPIIFFNILWLCQTKKKGLTNFSPNSKPWHHKNKNGIRIQVSVFLYSDSKGQAPTNEYHVPLTHS